MKATLKSQTHTVNHLILPSGDSTDQFKCIYVFLLDAFPVVQPVWAAKTLSSHTVKHCDKPQLREKCFSVGYSVTSLKLPLRLLLCVTKLKTAKKRGEKTLKEAHLGPKSWGGQSSMLADESSPSRLDITEFSKSSAVFLLPPEP